MQTVLLHLHTKFDANLLIIYKINALERFYYALRHVKTIFECLGPDLDYSDRVTVDNRALALIIIIDMLPLNKLISPFIWEVRHGSYLTTHTETNNIVSMRICLGQRQGTFIQELTCHTLLVLT